MTSKESALQANVIRWANKQKGVRARNIHASSATGRGEPDTLIVARGHAILIELKTDGYQTSDIQKWTIEQWVDAGATSCVCTSLDDVIEIVDRVLA